MTERRPAVPSDEVLRLALTRQPNRTEAALAVDGISTAIATVAQRRRTVWPILEILWADRRPAARLLLLAILLLLVTTIVAVVGSRWLLRSPIGPGTNGVVAYEVDGDLVLANADGTDPRRITGAVAWEFNPTFSPDGHLVAYWSTASSDTELGPLDLVVLDVRSQPPAGRTLVTVSGQAARRLVWSPDSRRIAGADLIDGVRTVYTVDVETGVSRWVGPPGIDAFDPVWSPDGTRIGFLGGRVESDRGFYIMNADGTDAHRISTISSRGRGYKTPVWSPAADRIAVSVEAGGADPFQRDIWVLSPDASTENDISNDPGDEVGPQWSPDGLRIAYLRAVGGPSAGVRVVVSDADERNATILGPTFPNATILGPNFPNASIAWAPDGTKLLIRFLTGRSEAPVELEMMDLATGAVTVVGAAGVDGDPSWQRLAP
jgi:Tol biopolymer transport system component